jgi:hypothetical protein
MRNASVLFDPAQVGEYVATCKNLLVAMIERALDDVRNDPTGKRLEGGQAFDWFWSDDFRSWCTLVGWEPNEYKFLHLRSKVKEIRVLGMNKTRRKHSARRISNYVRRSSYA